MWMSVLWDLTVTNMQDVRTQRAPTPAHVPTLTVETARTAQVTRCNKRSIADYFVLIHMQTCLFCVPTRASEVREPRVSRLRSQRWQQLSDGRWGCFWLRQRLRAGRLFPPPLPGNWKLGQSSPILQRWGGLSCDVMPSQSWRSLKWFFYILRPTTRRDHFPSLRKCKIVIFFPLPKTKIINGFIPLKAYVAWYKNLEKRRYKPQCYT